MSSEIPFIKPSFPSPDLVAAAYDDIVRSNWFTNFGPHERRFADELGTYLGGTTRVATVANGTLALIAALQVTAGHGDGTRVVLMPSFTFVAVAQAATWCGYRPMFIDVDERTWQPDHRAARAVLQEHHEDVAALLVPNAFGVGNPDIGSWESLAAEFDLPLILDSAAGFGSHYPDGGKVGGRGTCEIFSFHATKPFAIGEGGAVSSREATLVEDVKTFQNFGFGANRDSRSLGMNAKLQELNAAIGSAQLPGLDQRLSGRRQVYATFREALEPAGFSFQPNAETSSLCFASLLCASAELKKEVMETLARAGVQSRDYYEPPIHRQPYYAEQAGLVPNGDLAVTDDLCARIVSLPIHDGMDPADVDRIISAATEGHPQ